MPSDAAMEYLRSIELAIEKLRDSTGVYPLEDSEYGLTCFSFEELKLITDDFSEDNFIVRFQYGKVYRGFKGERVFTVKKWERPCPDADPFYYKGENELRQINEVIFLKETKAGTHPNLVKIVGYCRKSADELFMVYDLKPLNSMYQLVPEDSFTWLQRIKVLLGFAHLLHSLHAADRSNPYLLRNIDASHILVDEDYNPILYDFSLITGGVFPDAREYPNEHLSGCDGYVDVPISLGDWSKRDEVFSFGVLLLMLISRRVCSREDGKVRQAVDEWGRFSYKGKKSAVGFDKISLVHRSLLDNHGYHSDDGVQITKLGVSCVTCIVLQRPTMEQVIKTLLKLVVSRDHYNFLGIDRLQYRA